MDSAMDILNKYYTVNATRGLKCVGCNLGENYYSYGYRCFENGFFFHEECARSAAQIHNMYHPQHLLYIKVVAQDEEATGECKLCKGNLPMMYYYCSNCDFAMDLICARKEVLVTIEVPKIHEQHPLSLVPKMIKFTCYLCELEDDRFPYACKLCGLSFHRDCAESTPTLNYTCHPNHPLKRLTHVPSYTDGKCWLCENKFHNLFYHCSICNFSVDVNCAKDPPPYTLFYPKAHDHLLTLMPQRSFVCNACGMDDDPNPYVCVHCNFMIHINCLAIPRVIKINRHRHTILYHPRLDAGDWKCGVCHTEIKWTCGAYCCLHCSDFAAHLRCATRFGVWDGINLEGIVDYRNEVNSYEVMEEGVIKHFGHNHALKFKENSDANSDFARCKACSYPIFTSPFYACEECDDDFILHQNCAYLPKEKVDSIYQWPMTLVTDYQAPLICEACQNFFQGFFYRFNENRNHSDIRYSSCLDVRCASISEPFDHKSHPPHPLYITHTTETTFCSACGDKTTMFLSCEECRFSLDIKCSILPEMVKHQNDKDHVLTLCYGENTSVQYWCEACEEELDQKKWFYLCDHCGITLHIRCTLGDFMWLKQESSVEMFLNRVNRPICYYCGSRCPFPTIMRHGEYILCSLQCVRKTHIQLQRHQITAN